MLLTGQIRLTGAHIPTHKEIYEPVLKELELYGITFSDKTTEWNEAD
jgi:saccharopine dehydrogenase (NAD+, L-glutamate forming)